MIRSLVIVSSISLLAPAANAQVSFTPLGAWAPTGVSGDGSIVVGFTSGTTPHWGLRWTAATGVVPFPFDPQPGIPAIDLQPLAISDDGSTVVGVWSLNPGHPFRAIRWTATGGNKQLDFTMLDRESIARDVSADGSVVVGSVTPFYGDFGPAFRWTPSEVADLGETNAYMVSGDGRVIAGGPYRWTPEQGNQLIPELVGADAGVFAQDISTDGSVIVGDAYSHVEGEIFIVPQAFRWSASEGTIALGDLPGGDFLSGALGVSGNGSLIVGYGTVDGNVRKATFWTERLDIVVLQDFLTANGVPNLGEWHLRQASMISADGRTIVGSGTNPDGQYEAWVATIPEPSSLLLIGVAGLGLLAAVIRHRDRTARQR